VESSTKLRKESSTGKPPRTTRGSRERHLVEFKVEEDTDRGLEVASAVSSPLSEAHVGEESHSFVVHIFWDEFYHLIPVRPLHLPVLQDAFDHAYPHWLVANVL